ncbi:MAG: cupin domain-containing protein [Burkholderiaceae bacterium]|nr:cupin domain-containing protein [Burkholderiaceae bacterium]
MHNQDPAEAIVRQYKLKPHPEGGFYKETYRSEAIIPVHALPEGYPGPRNTSTAILYLLKEGDFSALHRIRQDEIWHFYLGGALHLVMLSPDGDYMEVLLGKDVAAGERVQYIVPAGWWFGAKPVSGVPYSFVGCTVSPGFDFEDFELGKRDSLLEQFPDRRETILAFTRED